MEKHDVAVMMGAADEEIVDFEDSPAGLIIYHRDGTSYIKVGDDTPDVNGRSGLMYLDPPSNYKDVPGAFPVYQPGAAVFAGAYDGMSKAELAGVAKSRGLDVKGNASKATLVEVLTADDALAGAYESMSVDELRTIAEGRALGFTPNADKDELVGLLVAYDAAPPADPAA